MKWKTRYLLAGGLTAALACLLFFVQPLRWIPFRRDAALAASLQEITSNYRKIIVLVDGVENLDDAARARSLAAGRILFWTNHRAIDQLVARLTGNSDGIRQFLQYLNSDPNLHDADKLAYLDVVEQLSAIPSRALRRNPLGDPLRKASDNLQAIQLSYREEVSRIFSQFATRGAGGTREKWDAYVAGLRRTLSREQILSEYGDAIPEEPLGQMRGGSNEIFGNEFQPKTVALTFDDGPHPRYTEQVLALLRKYGIRACFFELGVNLGTVQDGQATLSRTAEVSRKVLDAGHVIANHTYDHAVLPKLDVARQASEIDQTNLLLTKIIGRKPDLFRAPYGARNQEILQKVQSDGLKSIMWTIDSLDWADPVPESIAMRVLHEINQKHKGIILFHDIHKQSVMALSPVIEELQRQEYTFLAPQDGQFVKTAPPPAAERAADTAQTVPATPGASGEKPHFYRESWAVVVGVNDYQNWPKLRYAVNDANGIEEVLVNKFGFKKENIRKLINGDATRQRIMEVLGDELTDGRKVQRDDRVFFFFAGHGATRTFEDGRQIGFIVPVDADRVNYYSTAISMTALREASDLIPAKHIYFVMDSCYSGLALTRGVGGFSRDRSYLEEVTRRQARQILTAGGAEEQVADDGPGGHSVFTWALLQGLQGQADLDGNGFITASELGAYVSPIVSSFAKQTPTVGNLVGSEGGEFVFELQPEPLTSLTKQMDGQALHLNDELSQLQKEIAVKQAELLKIQQSIQSESAKLTQMTRSAPPVKTKTKAQQAYELDRQGQLLYREKKYADALVKFQGAVDLQPQDAVLLNNLGFLLYVMGRYEDAVSYLQKTLAVDPRRKEAHGNIADALLKLGRKDEAKQHYEQYLALYPNSPRAGEVRKIVESL